MFCLTALVHHVGRFYQIQVARSQYRFKLERGNIKVLEERREWKSLSMNPARLPMMR